MITSLIGLDGSFGLGKTGVGGEKIPVAEENCKPFGKSRLER